jgi:hypothetical protein
LAIVVGACSSGGDDDATTTSQGDGGGATSEDFAAFVEEASLACYDANRAQINPPINQTDLAEAIVDRAEIGKAQLSALEVPEADAAVVQRNLLDPYLTTADGIIAESPTLLQAAGGPPEAFSRALVPVFVVTFESWTGEQITWLKANGLGECAPDLSWFLRAG